MDGKFAGVGLHERPVDAHDVAQVHEVAEVGVALVPEVVAAQIALDASARVFERDEARLAHDPAQHHPARDRRVDVRLGERLLVQSATRRREITRKIVPAKGVRVGVAALPPLAEFAAPLVYLAVAVVAHTPAFKFASMNPSRSPSSTLPGSNRSTLVRRSFTRDWSST